MDINAWLKAACDDADRRQLAGLGPLLQTLARSTTSLREADLAARAADLVAGRADNPDDQTADRPR